jgi:GTP cyclohydrolase I
MSRPHIQEEAIVMLADELEQLIKPRGLALIMKATHTCMIWRGVKEHDTDMVTSVMRGVFMSNPAAKSEFLNIIAGQGFK